MSSDIYENIRKKLRESKYALALEKYFPDYKDLGEEDILLAKYELYKIYKYMVETQEYYRDSNVQIPFDIKYIIDKHGKSKDVINRSDVVLSLIAFCKSLGLIYGRKKIFDYRLKLVKIILWQELSSALVCNKYKFSRNTFFKILSEIENKLIRAIINSGEAIGVLTATSIASILTQLTLNSVSWDTRVVLMNDKREIMNIEIGQFIDYIIDSTNESRIEYYPQNRTECVSLEKNYYIVSCDKKGNTGWNRISHVTRHLPVGDLMRIETISGRIVHVTQSKSLIVYDSGKMELVKREGKDLRIGDLVPIVLKYPEVNDPIEYLDLSQYLSKHEYLYGSDFCRIRDLYLSDTRKKKIGFWKEHLGMTASRKKETVEYMKNWRSEMPDSMFTAVLPYNRPDNIIDVIKGKKLKSTEIIKGIIYPKKCSKVVSKIPEFIKLDREFGFIVGIYLAEGWSTNTFSGVSNNDKVILDKVRKWADSIGVTHHTVVSESKRFIGSKSTDLKLHSVILARLFKVWIGTGSSNKKIPPESYVSNLEFVKGILDGYYSGDGYVNKCDGNIYVTSASKQLIRGISSLCSRFGIFGKFSDYLPKNNNNIGSQNIKRVYRLSISNKMAQLFAKTIKFTLQYKLDRCNNITLKKEYKYLCGRNYYPFSNTILDPIKKIEYINNSYSPCVYDFSVPETGTFINSEQLVNKNTFHLAGVGTKGKVIQNMNTFRDLLNCTKNPNIKSVYIRIYFPKKIKNDEKFIRNIVKTFNLNYILDF
jgi:hypothetical protein